MNRPLFCVDGLAVTYLGITGGLFLLGWADGWVYRMGGLVHFGIALSIVGVSRARSLPPVLQWVRETYPVWLLLLFYAEVDLLVKLVHDPPGYDAIVRSWDALLFGSHPHLVLAQWLDGRLWREFFHLLYLSYYLLLIGSFFFMWSRRPAQFPQFAFVVMGMFVSFVVTFVLFPVAGPLATSDPEIMTAGWFPQIVAWLYVPLRINGIASGAFPSSHVGMSVGIACLLAPRRQLLCLLLWGLVLGIALSTVYGHFHYAIDAVAGGIVGGLLYVGWTALYTRLDARLSR